MKSIAFYTAFFISFLHLTLHSLEEYQVVYEGICDQNMMEEIRSGSRLLNLQEKPPTSISGLKRRIESDKETIENILQSYGYLEPIITSNVLSDTNPIQVVMIIDIGPRYCLSRFQIIGDYTAVINEINPIDLGIFLQSPVSSQEIYEAQEILLDLLARRGYPSASILDMQIDADRETQEVEIILLVDTGPLMTMGPTAITGISRVQERYIRKKIHWREGDIFDLNKIEKTLFELETTGLFRHVAITKDEADCTNHVVPLIIDVKESKHRTIGTGLGFMMHRGVGVTVEWEDRNLRGWGETLRLQTQLWKRIQSGSIDYLKPDFCFPHNNLILSGDIKHEITEGYTQTALTTSAMMKQQLCDHLHFSYGLMYRQSRDTHSDNDGNFSLPKLPLIFLWNHTDDLLNPTCGTTLNLKLTPTMNVHKNRFAYCITTATGTGYIPLDADHHQVIAGRLTIGSIFGSSRRTIPPSERFYAGSEQTIRGYPWLTVSPLDSHHNPIGGRSMFLSSIEGRFKLNDSWGCVFFYDIGNVYRETFPSFKKGILHSVGGGIRYYTPVGPLRLDIAFPLKRRPHIDNPFQIYLNIGQSF